EKQLEDEERQGRAKPNAHSPSGDGAEASGRLVFEEETRRSRGGTTSLGRSRRPPQPKSARTCRRDPQPDADASPKRRAARSRARAASISRSRAGAFVTSASSSRR